MVGAVVLANLVSAGAIQAGELEPQAPPGPTMKPLSDVEPRTAIHYDPSVPIVIDQSGSYYLAEDIFAMAVHHGIEITASHVNLDLNGYSVIGSTGFVTLDGIHAGAGVTNLEVHDGTVRTFGGNGLNLNSGNDCTIENVTVTNAGVGGTGYGIWIGDRGRIVDSDFVDNNGFGIVAGDGVVIQRVTVSGNTSGGILCSSVGTPGCNISDSVALDNGPGGFVVANGLVENCLAFGHSNDDIDTIKSVVRNCRAGTIDGNGTSLLVDNLAGAP